MYDVEKVKELSAVVAEIGKLQKRQEELEAYFLEQGCADVVDTKYKSRKYVDEASQASVTYTESQTLKISAIEYLKSALNKSVYADMFAEETKTVVRPKSKELERMLIGVFTGEFIRSMPEEVIAQIPCDDKAKAVLTKKLKGAKFETDRDTLMTVAGLAEADASDYAYMYAEAKVWQTLMRLSEMSGADVEQLIKQIRLGVAVSSAAKLTIV